MRGGSSGYHQLRSKSHVVQLQRVPFRANIGITRSEIVVPIRANGKIVGEIDIDSHTLNAFNTADRRFLEECAEVLTRFLESKDAFR